MFRLNAKQFSTKIEQMKAKKGKTYKLLSADGRFYESATKGTLGGHRKDKIYGTLDCKGAARWIAKGHYVKQRVFFADEATAIAAGFRPCYECLREKYRKWKAEND
jgi:methylphosphotriester-DNA--protein-cysteine methyltransferase